MVKKIYEKKIRLGYLNFFQRRHISLIAMYTMKGFICVWCISAYEWLEIICASSIESYCDQPHFTIMKGLQFYFLWQREDNLSTIKSKMIWKIDWDIIFFNFVPLSSFASDGAFIFYITPSKKTVLNLCIDQHSQTWISLSFGLENFFMFFDPKLQCNKTIQYNGETRR